MLGGTAEAQEAKIQPLQYNPQLLNYQEANDSKGSYKLMKRQEPDTLQTPFFEDFSYQKVYPDDSLWKEDQVFINNSLPINPPSYGVATFDGLDASGRPYNPSRNNKNNTLPTDSLTSQFIDLGSYDRSDSVFLSFFYQPKGNGESPERIDSLTLEFKSNLDTPQWQTVWSAGGGQFRRGPPPFKPVNLELGGFDSLAYFYETFQFRFVSYGNVSGNLDHWHLDYIELDADRRSGIPTRTDVAVVDPVETILSEYMTMPWRQIVENPNALRDTFYMKGSNNDSTLRRVKCGYQIKDKEKGITFSTFPKDFTENIPSYFGKRYYRQGNLFDNSAFLGRDSLDISIKTAVQEPSDNIESNDTFTVNQSFDQYLAYDDGTAEGGFGLSGRFFSKWKVAYKFNLNKPDSLRAVGFKFNRSREAVGEQVFDLMIWKDIGQLGVENGGEEVQVEKSAQPIRYNGKGVDQFVIYELEEPVEVSGPFYVGWKQLSPFLLNVGLDKNYKDLNTNEPPEDRIFVNYSGEWQTPNVDSIQHYALMIRPYLSQKPIADYTNRDETKAQKTGKKDKLDFSLYPNPANDFVNLSIKNAERHLKGRLIDNNGQVVKDFKFHGQQKRLDITNQRQGLYMLEIIGQDGIRSSEKLIVK